MCTEFYLLHFYSIVFYVSRSPNVSNQMPAPGGNPPKKPVRPSHHSTAPWWAAPAWALGRVRGPGPWGAASQRLTCGSCATRSIGFPSTWKVLELSLRRRSQKLGAEATAEFEPWPTERSSRLSSVPGKTPCVTAPVVAFMMRPCPSLSSPLRHRLTRSLSASFFFFLRGSCSVYSGRFCMSPGGGEFRILHVTILNQNLSICQCTF